MKKYWKSIVSILLLVFFTACGENTPKPLDKKFAGQYKEKLEVVQLEIQGKNLIITQKNEINNWTTKERHLQRQSRIEIENALFLHNKEKNRYVLQLDKIKNIRGSGTLFSGLGMFSKNPKTIKFENYQEAMEAMGTFEMDLTVNDTRKEVVLMCVADDPGLPFPYMVEGYKEK